MLGASLAMFFALAISFAATEALLPKHAMANWPNAVGALGDGDVGAACQQPGGRHPGNSGADNCHFEPI